MARGLADPRKKGELAGRKWCVCLLMEFSGCWKGGVELVCVCLTGSKVVRIERQRESSAGKVVAICRVVTVVI